MSEDDDFDIPSFLPYLLTQAAEASSLEFQRIYKARYGILRTEWRVLFHLGHFGEMTAREICDRTKTHKTKVSRAVQKLSDRRYVVRTRDEQDRRSERLSLTPQGMAVYRDLKTIAATYDRALLDRFSSADAENCAMRCAFCLACGLGRD